MKKQTITILLALALASCSNYRRIGTMTVLSTRNYDCNKEYVLLQRGAVGVAMMKHDDALLLAVEKVVNEFRGEYMENVVVAVKENGNRVRVTGDVWGLPGK